MALKCRGCHGPLNFPLGTYSKLLPYLDDISEVGSMPIIVVQFAGISFATSAIPRLQDELVATLRQLNKAGRIVDQRSDPTARAAPAAIDIHHQGLVQQTLLWPPQWDPMKVRNTAPNESCLADTVVCADPMHSFSYREMSVGLSRPAASAGLRPWQKAARSSCSCTARSKPAPAICMPTARTPPGCSRQQQLNTSSARCVDPAVRHAVYQISHRCHDDGQW